MMTEQKKQQEPVAWKYQFRTEDPVFVTSKRDWADNHPEWKETQLYTTPPTAALAAKAMRDAAVKGCEKIMSLEDVSLRSIQLCIHQIAALPVPEVQWRDLTDEELNDVWKEFHDCWGLCDKDGYGEAVIAKFKEVNK